MSGVVCSSHSKLNLNYSPEPGTARLSPDDKTPFDPANPDLVDYNGVLVPTKDFATRLDKILNEQFQINPLVRTSFMADIVCVGRSLY